MTLTPSVVSRFWSKVDCSGGWFSCWEWLAGKKKNGYGQFFVSPEPGVEKNLYAHRVAYEIFHGFATWQWNHETEVAAP